MKLEKSVFANGRQSEKLIGEAAVDQIQDPPQVRITSLRGGSATSDIWFKR